MKIYLRNPDTSSLENLIKEGFSQHSYQFVETYFDEECLNVQCRTARRSFEDLWEIAKTYFPETTEVILAKTLQNLFNKSFLLLSYCSDIRKAVFWPYPELKNKAGSLLHYVAEECKDTKGQSSYSARDIEALANS